MLATLSRSEMKYTVSPTHTGSMSFESVHGGETRSIGLQIDNPDRTILSTPVIPALLVPGIIHAVGDVGTVGRNLSLDTPRGNGIASRDPAFERHFPESGSRARRPSGARAK